MTGTKISYSTSEADWLLLLDHRWRTSPTVQKAVRKGQYLAIGWFLGLAAIMVLGSAPMAAGVLAFLAIAFWIILPRWGRRSNRKLAARMLQEEEGPILRGSQELEATEDCLTLRNDYERAEFKWAAVTAVESDESALYIRLGPLHGLVIPKRFLSAGDLPSFHSTVTRLAKRA